MLDSDSDFDEAIEFTPSPTAKRTKRQPPVDETSGEGCMQQFMPVKKTPQYRGKLCPETCTRAGKPAKRCIVHGGEELCPASCQRAGKHIDLCIEHGGNMLCPMTCETNHGKQKAVCYEHGGWSLCPKTCETNSGKQKSVCRQHGGSELCPEGCTAKGGGRKSRCPVHGGGVLCPESCTINQSSTRRKDYCFEHGGSALCPLSCATNAGKCKSCCHQHGGTARCPLICNITNGGYKADCFIHGGSAKCIAPCPNAGKYKKYCPDGCGGQRLCSECKMQTVLKKGSICSICEPVATRCARVREAKMAYRLQEWASKGLIPMYSSWNRRNSLADPQQCGAYRIDFVFELESMVLLMEYDEEMHSRYTKRCELARQAEASLGYGDLPVHWIRFNPDAFKVNGQTCRTGKKEREDMLLNMIQKAVAAPDFNNLIKIDYICYNKKCSPSDTESPLLNRFKFETIEHYIKWAEEKLV